MSWYDVSDYWRNGVAGPLQALSAAEVGSALRDYQALCAPGESILHAEQRLFGHLLYPWVARLVTHPAILAAVRRLIGPNILVWVSEFNSKAARSPGYFSWHQDLYYWRLHYPDPQRIPLVTSWLALTAASAQNGGLRVFPGSHTRLWPHVERCAQHNLLTRAQTVDAKIDEQQTSHLELTAGSFSLHHPLLLHASAANESRQARIGLVVRYLAPEITPPVRPAYAWLVSGEDRHGHWDHLAPLAAAGGAELRTRSMLAVQQATGVAFK